MMLAIDSRGPNDCEEIRDIVEEFSGSYYTQQSSEYYNCQDSLSKKLDDVKRGLNTDFSIEILNFIVEEILEFIEISEIKGHYPAYQQGDYFNNCIKNLKNY